MDSDSDFYGDEEIVFELKARVGNLDLNRLWQTHHDRVAHFPRPQSSGSITPTGQLHNAYEGRPDARQLSESVDEFLARLPPATTDCVPGSSDWIFIWNPYIPRENDEDLDRFAQGGAERLARLSEFAETSNFVVGKSQFVISREVAKERRAAVQDLTQLAVDCGVVSGKWMLFPDAQRVNEVWGMVARATANNELGTAAKVQTRQRGKEEGERLICIYTKDFRDQDDVARVLNRLRELELIRNGGKPIYYKTDAWTYLNIYSSNPWKIGASTYSSKEVFEYMKERSARRKFQ